MYNLVDSCVYGSDSFVGSDIGNAVRLNVQSAGFSLAGANVSQGEVNDFISFECSAYSANAIFTKRTYGGGDPDELLLRRNGESLDDFGSWIESVRNDPGPFRLETSDLGLLFDGTIGSDVDAYIKSSSTPRNFGVTRAEVGCPIDCDGDGGLNIPTWAFWTAVGGGSFFAIICCIMCCCFCLSQERDDGQI